MHCHRSNKTINRQRLQIILVCWAGWLADSLSVGLFDYTVEGLCWVCECVCDMVLRSRNYDEWILEKDGDLGKFFGLLKTLEQKGGY